MPVVNFTINDQIPMGSPSSSYSLYLGFPEDWSF